MTAPKTRHAENPAISSLAEEGMPMAVVAMATNIVLMVVKLVTGFVGHSQALIADGIESASDVVITLMAWTGFRYSLKPPDREHPFGHGKAEAIAGIFSGVALVGAAALIAWTSLAAIASGDHTVPKWFTLPVLAAVIVAKMTLSRFVFNWGERIESRALESDARHHYADALTSAAAFIGIAIALWGGPAYASADDWAALVACVVVAANGASLLRHGLHDVMDGAIDPDRADTFRRLALEVEGVRQIETCRARKSGVGYFVELHAIVDGRITVRQGHDIAHAIKQRLARAHKRIIDTVVHIEPDAPRHEN